MLGGTRIELDAGSFVEGFRRVRSRVGMIKRSTVSNAQLKAFRPLHLRPINLVVSEGSHPCLILRGASHLDAFSGYPCRT